RGRAGTGAHSTIPDARADTAVCCRTPRAERGGHRGAQPACGVLPPTRGAGRFPVAPGDAVDLVRPPRGRAGEPARGAHLAPRGRGSGGKLAAGGRARLVLVRSWVYERGPHVAEACTARSGANDRGGDRCPGGDRGPVTGPCPGSPPSGDAGLAPGRVL